MHAKWQAVLQLLASQKIKGPFAGPPLQKLQTELVNELRDIAGATRDFPIVARMLFEMRPPVPATTIASMTSAGGTSIHSSLSSAHPW